MESTIQLAEDQRLQGDLTDDHRRLSSDLLMCNRCVVLRAIPLSLNVTRKRQFDKFNCAGSVSGKSLQDIPGLSIGGTTFWIENGRRLASIRMQGVFADPRVCECFRCRDMGNLLGDPALWPTRAASDYHAGRAQ